MFNSSKIFNKNTDSSAKKHYSEDERRTLAERLKTLEQMFTSTELGARISQWMADNDIQVVFDLNMPEKYKGQVLPPYDTVYLNPNMRDLDLIFTIAHEARHLWQARQLSEYLSLTTPELKTPFLFNPYALAIYNRFLEADASSFQHCFMIDYFDKHGRDDEMVNIAECSWLTIENLGWSTEKAPLSSHRQSVFKHFFLEKNRCQFYDHEISHSKKIDENLLKALADHDTEQYPNLEAEHPLTESILTNLGETAWGELPEENFLKSLSGHFNMKAYYTSGFSKKSLKRFKRLSRSTHSKDLNTYITRDGKKHTLINLKNR